MSEQANNGQRNNNNNRNNNRNRNNGKRNNNRNRNNNRKPRQHKPKPLVLSTWQKILIFFKLTSEDKIRKQLQANRPPRKKTPGNDDNNNSKPAKSNTRGKRERKAPQKVAVESPRLYVGNLSYDATEHDIEDLFKGIGSVKKVEIIYNKHTHRSKGYGFVQMLNVDEAKRAVEVLHDQPFLGRNLIVNGSKARKPSDPNSKNFKKTEETTTSEETEA